MEMRFGRSARTSAYASSAVLVSARASAKETWRRATSSSLCGVVLAHRHSARLSGWNERSSVPHRSSKRQCTVQ